MDDHAAFINDFLSEFNPALSPETKEQLLPCLHLLHLPKKHQLIRENEVSSYVYLLVKGAAKSYYLHNGKEIITWFAFENEVIGSLRNYAGLASKETIELLEPSTLISFNLPALKRISEYNTEVAAFVNLTLVEYAIFLEDKLYFFQLKSATEKYEALTALEPDVFNRVSLTHIASFLGISRETLSRLRSK